MSATPCPSTSADQASAESDGPYYGVYGIQWRGYVAYICGILINVVGFAGAVGTPVPIGATRVSSLLHLNASSLTGSDLSIEFLHGFHSLWWNLLRLMSILPRSRHQPDWEVDGGWRL